MRIQLGSYSTKVGRLNLMHANTHDASVILSLFREVVSEGVFMVTSVDELSRSVFEQEKLIELYQETPNSCYLIGRVDGKIVGVASIWGGELLRTRHVGVLEIYLKPEYRGFGIGIVFMERLLQWAGENPVLEKLTLSVFHDNEAAIRLYEKLGFSIEGRAVGDFKEENGDLRDRLLMAKWL